MRRTSLLVLLLAAQLPGASLRAQAIKGHLLDDEQLTPVGGATITLLVGEERGVQVMTRDDGSFFIPLQAWGTYRLEAQRIGYGTTTSQPFLVERADTVTVDFRVLPDAVLLAPLVVTTHTNQGRNVFYRRMENWDQGIFVTPEMVDSIQPRHPADVLRHQPKVWLSWGWARDPETGSAGPVPKIHTFMGSGCLSYLIDGRPIRRPRFSRTPVWLDWPMSMLEGKDIVAVEIYRHISEVPLEIRNAADEIYNGQSPPGVPEVTGTMADRVQQDFVEGTCGLVNFWTRVGW